MESLFLVFVSGLLWIFGFFGDFGDLFFVGVLVNGDSLEDLVPLSSLVSLFICSSNAKRSEWMYKIMASWQVFVVEREELFFIKAFLIRILLEILLEIFFIRIFLVKLFFVKIMILVTLLVVVV